MLPGHFWGRRGVFESLRSVTAWRVRGIALCGYDGTSASPDFENGAITGAFGYLFNDLAHLNHTAQGATAGTVVGAGTALGCDIGTVGVCTLADPFIVGAGTLIGGVGGLISDTAETASMMRIGPFNEPVIVGDPKGNNIPLAPGETLEGSENGDYVQVKGPNGQPTGVRGDFGGHPAQSDPAAQGPYAHVPGVTTPDGNPHFPVHQ